MQTPKELTVYPDKKKMKLILASGILMLPIGILLMFLNVAWLLSPVLVLAGLLNIYNGYKSLVANKPILIINKDGITDNMNTPSLGFIAWKDVEKADLQEIVGFEHLVIYLKNPEAHIEKASAMKRNLMRSNLKNTGSFSYYRTNIMPESGDKMLMVVNHFINQVR